MELSTVILAALGGIIPALIWVWFWNREDAKHPEPLPLIIAAFLIGMVAVAIVIPFQKIAATMLFGTPLVLAWAAIEEVIKFLLAYFTVLAHKANDEPVDALIYVITIALGFAAAENALFLIEPISTSGFVDSVLTGNFRFLGATLLHVLASSLVGIALGLSFYKSHLTKFIYGAIGLILAIALHGLFNFLILRSTGGELIQVFSIVWGGLIVLLLAFEKVKRIRRT